MLSPARLFRSALIAVGLASLAVVVVPRFTEPLWDWTRMIALVAGNESLPSFGVAQHYSALALTTFVLGGIGYNLWRDRRHQVMRAEYECRTGSTQLKEKVTELQAQLRRMTADRDQWQESYLALTKQHTDALIQAKEYEVRSEYGRTDREVLRDLRKDLEALVQARGQVEGFREAMQFFLASISDPGQAPEAAGEARPGEAPPDPRKDKRALPFALPART